MHLGPALVHYLLRVERVGVVCGHFLRRDARVLHWQVVYLVRIHDVFLLHSHAIVWPVYCSVHALILRELGPVALVSEVAEVAVACSLGIVRCLIHCITAALILVVLLVASVEEVILGVASQRTDRRVVKLCTIDGVLIAIVISAVECVDG
jgi:hypothetical protein